MIFGLSYLEWYLLAGFTYAAWGAYEIVSDEAWKTEYGTFPDWVGLAVFMVGATLLWPALFLLDTIMFFLVGRKS